MATACEQNTALEDICRQPARRGEAKAFLDKAFAYEGDECLTWPFSMKNGYGNIGVGGRNYYAHRLVCTHFRGVAPTPHHQAAHSCANKSCVNPRHLRWATRGENEADKLVHGTHNRGERCGSAKLTADDVREIRRLRGRVSLRKLAARYDVQVPTICKINSGENWGWL